MVNETTGGYYYTLGNIAVMLGNGAGTFQAPVTYGTGGSYPTSVAVADLNGDGNPDILVANGVQVGVLLGNGDGTFGVNKSCAILVTFKPLSAGARTAAVSISDNAPNSPQEVWLSGVGVQPE